MNTPNILAHAKINWALNIVRLRPDGYHEMDMVMQSISLADELSISPADALRFDGDEDNLVIRAARALSEYAGGGQGADIRLVKRIPSRAGLGGGSADAAAALVALNRMWGLDLSMETLMEIGLRLGADVPFCVGAGPARAQGLGEALSPIELPQIELVILHPSYGLSTPAMFRAWDAETPHTEPADIEGTIAALQSRDFGALNTCARNMLYACAATAMPAVDEARRALLGAGAAFAAMTGSGSAVYGAFESAAAADSAASTLEGAIRAHTI